MRRKSTKKYRHDMIQSWVNQIDNKWVEESFHVTIGGKS
jgi:hypothetical protein